MNGHVAIDTDDVMRQVGESIRRLRRQRGFTLQMLAERTGLTPSMLSMVERGRTSPSIGTLVAIASALRLTMSALFELTDVEEPVNRHGDQAVFETAAGVVRRVLQIDKSQGLEFVVNEYEPGTSNSSTEIHHEGTEYGVLIEGELTVELNGEVYELRPNDAITYASQTPHRITNTGRQRARAVWVKLDR
jgi:transcriptional regulator with XRE-family HTH domain